MKETEYTARVQAQRAKLYRTAYLTLGSEDEALNAVDEAVFRGLVSLKKLRRPDGFDTWLMRILVNECATALRRKVRADGPLPETEQERSDTLPAELSETPLRLDYTVDRALPRYETWRKRRKLKRVFGIPLVTLAAVCAAFVILVNASPAFAETARSVSWLSELADYVALDPALDRTAAQIR